MRYDIAVSSDQFDTMLQVFRAGEDRALLTVDDSATDTNARTVFVPDRSGDYVVRALAFSPESLGTYHLLINAVPPLPAPLPTAAPAGTSAGRMSWRAYRGALAETDANSDGIPFDDYLVTLAAGEEIIVRLDSTQIDPLLRIYRADRRDSGTLTSDDDGGIGRNSMLAFAAPRAGNYVIRATAFWPTQTRARFGSYLLRIGR